MSKQLNESNEIWNEIKLVNSAKRISKHSSSNHKRQSIKLQIELPYMENSNDNIKMKKSSTFTESSFNNESEEEEEDLNENQTIRLQISFDSRPRFTPRKVNINKQQLQHTAKKQCSSGYSSSTSSMVNYVCANNQEKSFYLADNVSNNYNSERFSNENIYDKLNYNVSTSTKRKSMASVDSSMSSCSAASSSSSSSNSSFASTSKPKVYYEEISNFSQLHESKQRTYENDLIKPAPQVKSQVYKREYTVNEIFQNLESFKIEAKQQEKLNNNYAHSQQQLADKNTTNISKPKSVSFLKQIFETKITKKTTAVECLSGVKQQQQQQPIKQQTKQHVYVNEKLSRP